MENKQDFLYIDECTLSNQKIKMDSDFIGPVNIGSEEMVTINQLVDTAAKVAGKKIEKKHIDGRLVFVVVTQTMISFVRN